LKTGKTASGRQYRQFRLNMSGSTCYNLKNGFGFFLQGNAPGDYNPDTDPTGLEREEAPGHGKKDQAQPGKPGLRTFRKPGLPPPVDGGPSPSVSHVTPKRIQKGKPHA
jgi:hypothetical protein